MQESITTKRVTVREYVARILILFTKLKLRIARDSDNDYIEMFEKEESADEYSYSDEVVAKELFVWSRFNLFCPPDELEEMESELETVKQRLCYLDYQGIELCHWQTGIIGTLDEGWSCLLVTMEGDFILMEGTKRSGQMQTVVMETPESLRDWLTSEQLREVLTGVLDGKVYDVGTRGLWLPRDEEVSGWLQQRQDARERGDEEKSGDISAFLEMAGIAVSDTPGKPVWKRTAVGEIRNMEGLRRALRKIYNMN
ncbi:MAG: hypothetical protein QGG57_06710 [Candidatus Poseidoniia archaeon]|mgnify:CR=1 FL=1|jgi:hypothetical protein|nr:hypothetical protein [Candidatus Poseidoniia archaeon]|tara:strand:+ start:964 stop:1728 length:765 start_codon:yes stop_codon:yes gene_type:complete